MRGVSVLLFICSSSQLLALNFTQRRYSLSQTEDMSEDISGYIILEKNVFLSSCLLICFPFFLLFTCDKNT